MTYLNKFLLSFFFVQTVFTFANEQWMEVHNLKEFNLLIKRQETQKELKILCFLQLENKTIPYSCYEWLKYKKRKTLPLQYLNEKCQEFSVYLKKPKKIKELLKKGTLSPFCHKKVREQKKRIEYQLRDQSISKIFTWYFIEDF